MLFLCKLGRFTDTTHAINIKTLFSAQQMIIYAVFVDALSYNVNAM